MNEILKAMAAGIAANLYLGTEIAFRVVDALVTKDVLSKQEAAATLEAIAEGIRQDANADPSSSETIEAAARTLNEFAAEYRQ